MTRVSIIEVELGQSIDDIVMDDITEITKSNRDDIDAAIASAKLLQEVANRRKKEVETNDLVLGKLYDTLVAAYTNRSYVSSKEIISISGGQIANMISFAGRMRGYLKDRGNEYRLVPCKRNKETAYCLEPFNAAPRDEGAAQVE